MYERSVGMRVCILLEMGTQELGVLISVGL